MICQFPNIATTFQQIYVKFQSFTSFLVKGTNFFHFQYLTESYLRPKKLLCWSFRLTVWLVCIKVLNTNEVNGISWNWVLGLNITGENDKYVIKLITDNIIAQTILEERTNSENTKLKKNKYIFNCLKTLFSWQNVVTTVIQLLSFLHLPYIKWTFFSLPNYGDESSFVINICSKCL